MTTIRDLLDAPPMLPLWPDVAAILDVGKTRALELAAAGELPVAAVRLGARWMVPTAPLLRYLGVRPPGDPEPAEVAARGRLVELLVEDAFLLIPTTALRRALGVPGTEVTPSPLGLRGAPQAGGQAA